MANTIYEKTIATDITAALYLKPMMHGEIDALSLPGFVGLRKGTAAGKFRVEFTAALSAPDLATLDAAVLAHLGTRQVIRPVMAVEIQSQEQVITAVSPSWDVVGYTTARPAQLIPSLANAFGRLVGRANVSGTLEFRIVETKSTSNVSDMNPTPISVPDTAGLFDSFKGKTTVDPRGGRNEYRVDARLVTGGDTATIRGIVVALFYKETQNGIT